MKTADENKMLTSNLLNYAFSFLSGGELLSDKQSHRMHIG